MNTECNVVTMDGRFFLKVEPVFAEKLGAFPLYPLNAIDVEMIVTKLTDCLNCYVCCDEDGEIGVTALFKLKLHMSNINDVLDLFGARMSQVTITFSIPTAQEIMCKIVLFPADEIPF